MTNEYCLKIAKDYIQANGLKEMPMDILNYHAEELLRWYENKLKLLNKAVPKILENLDLGDGYVVEIGGNNVDTLKYCLYEQGYLSKQISPFIKENGINSYKSDNAEELVSTSEDFEQPNGISTFIMNVDDEQTSKLLSKVISDGKSCLVSAAAVNGDKKYLDPISRLYDLETKLSTAEVKEHYQECENGYVAALLIKSKKTSY